MKLNGKDFLYILKQNVYFQNEHFDSKLCKQLKKKLSNKNAISCYQMAKRFKMSKLYEEALSYIHCCFTMLFECKSFLELDITSVVVILASSGLSLTTELEVFNFADKWLSHNIKDRCKFAKDLLLTVRLPLLPDSAFKSMLYMSSSFCKLEECFDLLQEICASKSLYYKFKSNVQCKARHCNQRLFKFVAYSTLSRTAVGSNHQLDDVSLTVLPSPADESFFPRLVTLKGEIYALGGRSVKMYSPNTKIWIKLSPMPHLYKEFCTCAFIDEIFTFGGAKGGTSRIAVDRCFQYSAKSKRWKKVAKLRAARRGAACAVFEEKIVVTGGCSDMHFATNTVFSYDVAADEWRPMPSMKRTKGHHSLVAVRSKLFVVGCKPVVGSDSEVFDSAVGKFVLFKCPPLHCSHNAFSIGTKIYIFQSSVVVYDVDNNNLSEVGEDTQNYRKLICAKLPMYR